VEGGARVLNEEELAVEAVLRRRWDTAGSALLGAGFGALVQGSHEFQHNFIAPSGVREPIASILVALALATLAFTILFTAITVAHNIIVMRLGRKKSGAELAWHRSDFDFAGIVLAILLVLAHEAFNFLSGRWQLEFLDSADPFYHIVWELIIAGLGGELLFRAAAKARGWNAV
jgi:hypothetical protein